ncbi:concanavalin A-like lectin glucanase [Lecanosticta acicola]|uniref:Concanavalin A-like lectin glucanase, partial n=1 Tax=Lecanosticta acicola TaxID=111012 RepID=A0AAI9EA18_9PEZI|nr:concanavalin A-like lectin glucanase [Lecanosticta acicola]
MFFFAVTAILAGANAQRYDGQFAPCNPMVNATGACTPNPGLPTSTYSIDFTQQTAIPANWTLSNYATMNFSSDGGAEFVYAKRYDAPQLWTDFYILFGRVSVEARVANGTGMISSSVLISDDFDEIDFEFSGNNYNMTNTNGKGQNNYFGKGITGSYDRGQYFDVSDPQDSFHTYTFDWSPDALKWEVDGVVIRTFEYNASTTAVGSDYQYPQTPSRLQLGIWAGGDPGENEGTISWAGGITDTEGGPYTMYVRRVEIENYMPGYAYNWTDQSGTWQSIQILSRDVDNGTAVGGGSTTNSASDSSSTSAPTSGASTADSAATTSPTTTSSTSSTPITGGNTVSGQATETTPAGASTVDPKTTASDVEASTTPTPTGGASAPSVAAVPGSSAPPAVTSPASSENGSPGAGSSGNASSGTAGSNSGASNGGTSNGASPNDGAPSTGNSNTDSSNTGSPHSGSSNSGSSDGTSNGSSSDSSPDAYSSNDSTATSTPGVGVTGGDSQPTSAAGSTATEDGSTPGQTSAVSSTATPGPTEYPGYAAVMPGPNSSGVPLDGSSSSSESTGQDQGAETPTNSGQGYIGSSSSSNQNGDGSGDGSDAEAQSTTTSEGGTAAATASSTNGTSSSWQTPATYTSGARRLSLFPWLN